MSAVLKPDATRPAPPPYERDFYTWACEQAAALRAGRLDEIDVLHLAEEIEDLGNETFNKLSGAYRVILTHMLQWDHQPERRSRSWAASIDVKRIDAGDVVADNPGLIPRRDEALQRAYRQARIRAAAETKRDKAAFPVTCPYSVEETMTRPFAWPDA